MRSSACATPPCHRPALIAKVAQAPFEHPPLFYLVLGAWQSLFRDLVDIRTAEALTRAFSVRSSARCWSRSWPRWPGVPVDRRSDAMLRSSLPPHRCWCSTGGKYGCMLRSQRSSS